MQQTINVEDALVWHFGGACSVVYIVGLNGSVRRRSLYLVCDREALEFARNGQLTLWLHKYLALVIIFGSLEGPQSQCLAQYVRHARRFDICQRTLSGGHRMYPLFPGCSRSALGRG